MQPYEPHLSLAGRVLLGTIYIWAGTHKIFNPEGTQAYMAEYGLTFGTTLLYLGATLVEIGGGVSLVLGFLAREASMMLVAFMVLVTLIFHTHLTDPNQLIHFLKNLAMTGGLFYVWAYGAGELSSDARTGASATDRTDGQQAAFSLIGRILLATIFMVSGVVKLLDPGGTHRQIHAMGLTTATPLLYIGSLVLEIGGGLSLLMGAWPRIGAVALIVFLIAATLLFHRTSLSFVIDAAVQDHQFHLMKNVAILGGLLYVWAFGAGRISFEEDPSVPRSQRPRVSY